MIEIDWVSQRLVLASLYRQPLINNAFQNRQHYREVHMQARHIIPANCQEK